MAAKRTAFGKYGGKLRAVPPVKLMEHASKATLQAANLDPELIDSVVLGQIYMVYKANIFS